MNNDLKKIVLGEIQKEPICVRAISALKCGVLSVLLKSHKEICFIKVGKIKNSESRITTGDLLATGSESKDDCIKSIKSWIIGYIHRKLKEKGEHFERIDIGIALQEILEGSIV